MWACKRVGHDLVTKQQQLALRLLNYEMSCIDSVFFFPLTVKTTNTISTFALCNALFVTSDLFSHGSDLVV